MRASASASASASAPKDEKDDDDEDDDDDDEETTKPAGAKPSAAAQAEDKEEDDDDDDDDAESTVSFGAEVDLLSQYIWRGLTLSSGPVLQPSTFVRVKGVELSATSNLVLTDPGEQGHFNEVDLDLRYQGRWRRLTFEPIAHGYLVFGDEPIELADTEAPLAPPRKRISTLEAAFRLTCSVGPVDFFTEHAVDVISYLGAYYGELGAMAHYRWHGHKSTHWSVTVEGGVSVALASDRFNNAYWGVSKTTVDLLSATAALTYYPTRHFYLRAHAEVSTLTDLDLRAAAESPDTWVVGQAIGFDFDF